MQYGFIKAAALTAPISVANPKQNAEAIAAALINAAQKGVKLAVFPELSLTGYTAGDMLAHPTLLTGAKTALLWLAEKTKACDTLFFVGLPLRVRGSLYNCAAAVYHGEILGVVPKTHLPCYAEFSEKRTFRSGIKTPQSLTVGGKTVPFGTNLLFTAENLPSLCVAAELCEDLWVANPPSVSHAAAGATVIVNLSANSETVGKAEARKRTVSEHSRRIQAAYLYAEAGEGESTTDLVFSGHNLVCENGKLLIEALPFSGEGAITEIDVDRLAAVRAERNAFFGVEEKPYREVYFTLPIQQTELTRPFDQTPFLPKVGGAEKAERILRMQAEGLKKRLLHTGAKKAVLGISGGLDSTLALIVIAKAFDLIGKPRADILCITMPCYGTTDRTYQNACALTNAFGATLREIPVKAAVTQHLSDISHSGERDVTYENAQARERTQVLMDVANQMGGIVVGTGDLSELALGWATYGGDHLSSYGVNASVPKTLVRYLVSAYAEGVKEQNPTLAHHLIDVVLTPVSPELLPPSEGEIAQKTEDLVGPYELHDFFLHAFLKLGYSPLKIYRVATYAFQGAYSSQTVKKWLTVFFRRFFSQQFKRSCLPDGAKIGSVSLSPRGDFHLPSDIDSSAWLEELAQIED